MMISATGTPVSVTERYHYGDTPKYSGPEFIPAGMKFVSWGAELLPVTQDDVVYTAQYEPTRLKGDLNDDGVVNTRDVAMLRQYVVGKLELSDDVLAFCNLYEDYNDDGSVKINTRDVALLQQLVVQTEE